MKEDWPVPPEETGSALVSARDAAEMVPVAVRFATERFPEKSPLPWTERACEGEVVPMPTLPALLLKMFEPEIVHGVLMVSAVPPTSAPGVPENVTPVPAVTLEVAIAFTAPVAP